MRTNQSNRSMCMSICVCIPYIDVFFILYFIFCWNFKQNLRWRLFLRFVIFNKTLIKYFRLIGSLSFRFSILVYIEYPKLNKQLMDDFAEDFISSKQKHTNAHKRIYAIGLLNVDAGILSLWIICFQKTGTNALHIQFERLKAQPDRNYYYFISAATQSAFSNKYFSTVSEVHSPCAVVIVQWIHTMTSRTSHYMCYNYFTAGITLKKFPFFVRIEQKLNNNNNTYVIHY